MARNVARTLRITGHVQGVAYRAWTRNRADREGLAGWVRNDPDGAVTAYLQGPEDAVERMITACHEGPGAAEVRDVQVEEADTQTLEGFVIRS